MAKRLRDRLARPRLWRAGATVRCQPPTGQPKEHQSSSGAGWSSASVPPLAQWDNVLLRSRAGLFGYRGTGSVGGRAHERTEGIRRRPRAVGGTNWSPVQPWRTKVQGTSTLPKSGHRSLPRTAPAHDFGDRKSTRLNSSHSQISYAVFCLKKKKKQIQQQDKIQNIISKQHSCD